MRPIAFGGRFGWLHPGHGTHGVVICSPFGHEEPWCHKGIRYLAEELSAYGIPVNARTPLASCPRTRPPRVLTTNSDFGIPNPALATEAATAAPNTNSLRRIILALDLRSAPVNKQLEATPPERANAQTRALIEQWGQLHAGRSVLGAAATLIYLWAMA